VCWKLGGRGVSVTQGVTCTGLFRGLANSWASSFPLMSHCSVDLHLDSHGQFLQLCCTLFHACAQTQLLTPTWAAVWQLHCGTVASGDPSRWGGWVLWGHARGCGASSGRKAGRQAAGAAAFLCAVAAQVANPPGGNQAICGCVLTCNRRCKLHHAYHVMVYNISFTPTNRIYALAMACRGCQPPSCATPQPMQCT
jgi:hypothetical protein